MTFSNGGTISPRRILIFHCDQTRANHLAVQFTNNNMMATACSDADMALAILYNDPPDLIVIHQDVKPKGGVELARLLKADNIFAHLPILLLVPKGDLKSLLTGDDYPFDDYIEDDASWDDLLARVSLSILRAHRQLDANPLTRLPGNNSIIKELETRLARHEEFAVVYCDLDNFKAFNDRYGFTRGDEALRLAARLIVNCVSSASPRDYYVGHVGGDDFIFIVPDSRIEAACDQLTANFDAIAGSLYDDEDRRNGFINSTNRKGEKETFPLMSISLAVVVNTNGQFGHPGEISAVAADLKKEIKKVTGSGYVVDRRDHRQG